MKRQVFMVAVLIAFSANAFAAPGKESRATEGRAAREAREKMTEGRHQVEAGSKGAYAGKSEAQVAEVRSRFERTAKSKLERALKGGEKNEVTAAVEGMLSSLKADLTPAEQIGLLKFLNALVPKGQEITQESIQKAFDEYVKVNNLNKELIKKECEGV